MGYPMRTEERVRLLRDVGHDVSMSCCIVTLNERLDHRIRKVTFRLRHDEHIYEQVVVLGLHEGNPAVERAMHQAIDAVLASAKLP